MNEQPYRLTRKTLTRIGKSIGDNVVIKTGEVFVPTDSELRDFGDRLEKVIVESPAIIQSAQPVSPQEPLEETEQSQEAAAKEDEVDPVAAASGALFKEKIASLPRKAVMAEVEAKRFDPHSVLEAEKIGQERVTLIRWLEKFIKKQEG